MTAGQLPLRPNENEILVLYSEKKFQINFLSKYFLKIQKLLGVGCVDLLKHNKLGRQKEVIGMFAKVITFDRIKHHKQTGKSNYKTEETM